MRRLLVFVALLWVSLAPEEPAPPLHSPTPADVEFRTVPGVSQPAILARRTVLIRADSSTLARILSRYPVSVLSSIPRLSVYRLRVPDGQEDAIAAALAREPGVVYAEREPFYFPAVFPDDDKLAQQWHLPRIRAFAAWDVEKGSDNIAVAVVDTGVSVTHPDLAPRIASGGYDFVDNDDDAREEPGTGQDKDGDGTPDKNVGHGTSVAGIIGAATNNQIGVAGVTWFGRILPVRIFPQDGASSVEIVAKGILWAAADSRVRVINLSLSGPSDSSVLRDAIEVATQSGKLVVAAAGNYSSSSPVYPASYPEVVAVAALSQTNSRASFSNYGSWVDISAPGVNLTTTGFTKSGTDTYNPSFTGTSAAAPVVSGVAMLLFSAHPTWTVEQVRSHLLLTARSIDAENPDYIGQLGAGLVDAQNAVYFGDISPPRIVSATALSNTVTLVSFDEALQDQPISAGASSCSSANIPVYSARLSSNPTQVEVFTGNQTGGVTYTLTCSNFKDLAGNSSSDQQVSFIGTNALRNFLSAQQGAVASRLDSNGSASFLNDGIPNNYFEINLTQERAFEIKLASYQALDSIVIRYNGDPAYFVLETGLQSASMNQVGSGYIWSDLSVPIPPNTIRYVRLRFPASPGSSIRLGELEGYRRDTDPPAFSRGPSIATISDTEVRVTFEAREPVSGKLFYKQVGSPSWLFANIQPLAYTHSVSLSNLAPMTTYEWYLDLTDGWGNRLLYPDVAGGEPPLTFRASSQYLVTHQPPKPFAVIGRSLPLSIIVSPAPLGVDLFYSLPQGGFASRQMSQSGESFSSSVPGSSVTGSGVSYHFVVRTTGGDLRYPGAGEFVVPATLLGDANGDGLIDDRDALEIGLHIGLRLGDAAFSTNLDVDGDDQVTAADLTHLLSLLPD
jgi:subtilisin family serine protease